jgi:hypothetical protein
MERGSSYEEKYLTEDEISAELLHYLRLLVRMVTESTSGYILNLEIYAGEGKK